MIGLGAAAAVTWMWRVRRERHTAAAVRMLDTVEHLFSSERFDEAFSQARCTLQYIERKLGSGHPLIIDALYLIGTLHVRNGHWLEAKDTLECLRSISSGSNARRSILVARALEESARCSAKLGDEAGARRLLDEAEALRTELERTSLIETVEMRARVARILGHLEEAESIYATMISMLGDARSESPYRTNARVRTLVRFADGLTAYDVHGNRAIVLLMSGHEDEGAAELSRAHMMLASETDGNIPLCVGVLRRWATKCEIAGLLENAWSLWREITTTTDDPQQSVNALCRAAWCARERGDANECESLLEQALGVAHESETRAQARQTAAMIAFRDGDIERGEALVGDETTPSLEVVRASAYIAIGSFEPGLAILEGLALNCRYSSHLAHIFYLRGHLSMGRPWEDRARASLDTNARVDDCVAVAMVSALRLTIEGRFRAAALCWEGIRIPGEAPILRARMHHVAGWRALEAGDSHIAVT